MDKELVGWSRPQGCGQWLYIHVEAAHERRPTGSALGPPLFNILISDTAQGIDCSLSKFADGIKLSGAADTAEGRHAVQRDLDKLKPTRAHLNPRRFSQVKGKALHLRGGNARYVYTTGEQLLDNSPAEKDLGVPVDENRTEINFSHG